MKKKSAEKKRHVVAWANKAEWDQVLEYLYSADPALQRFALQRVSAWRGRYASSCPVAVDCTADLVRCQVLDRAGQLDAEELVLLYGAGLVRFVNLITERQQGRTARPLRRLAGNLDIPEWVVNLRHDVTHRKLPTLTWCRKGCKVVLEWLQQKYWSRQLGGGPHEDWDSESDGEEEEEEEEEGGDQKRHGDALMARQQEMEAYKDARELLISFEKEQFRALDGPPEDQNLSALLAELKLLALQSGALLVDVLLEDGFLVPTAEQLETLGCGGGADRRDAAEPRLAPAFLRFWLPLLRSLYSASFIHLLLEKLFVELKPLSGAFRAFYVAAWISEIIVCNGNKCEFHFETKGQKKARMKDRLFVNRIQLRWQQLLSACLEAPCASTPRLLQLVLDDMEHPLPPDTRHKLLQLCSIYTQGARREPDPRPGPRPVYTLESLRDEPRHARRLHPRRAEAERGEASPDGQAEKAKGLRGSAWQLCSDKVPWRNYPLGKVPGQSDDPSRLMVERYSTLTVVDQPVELEAPHHVPGGSAPLRTADGLLWNHSDVNKMKSGLTLF
ncbi:Ribosomal biogenesis protein LAS1L [Liparis tanakae]|uniref:Ribosomal biogenesis protein LAS1L n=1 Tax=Liparis tanakae TaxID=230148 RepID=A0A4Z2ESQ7_9TELE|nr:Ribosomal biogenesis protein LAS1L [Liparis tanakae]